MKVLSQERRRPRVRTVNTDPHMTVQGESSTEIRDVLSKFKEVGILPHMRQVDLDFRDVSEFSDFVDVMRASADARQAFLRLPPQVRDVFGNDPARWLDAAHDAEKLEALRPQLEKIGVMQPVVSAPKVAADGRLLERRKLAELEPDKSLVNRRAVKASGVKPNDRRK